MSRREEDEQQSHSVPVDLGAAQNEHAGDGEQQRQRVSLAASGDRRDGDRADELDRDGDAEVDAVDAEVEERVHQRGDDAEERRGEKFGPGPTLTPCTRCDHHGDRRADDSEPRNGLGFDLVEQADGDDGTQVLGDGRQDEERLGLGGVQPAGDGPRRALVRQAHVGAGEQDRAYSNSSGSVWAISSHSGWKLNQPAAWNPVFCWV